MQTLPHWQLESIFPGLDSPIFREAQERFKHDLTALQALMDERQIHSQREPVGAEVELFETLLERFNALYTTATDIGAYLYGFISTDAFNASWPGSAHSRWKRCWPSLSWPAPTPTSCGAARLWPSTS